jgi:hypothetical protein
LAQNNYLLCSSALHWPYTSLLAYAYATRSSRIVACTTLHDSNIGFDAGVGSEAFGIVSYEGERPSYQATYQTNKERGNRTDSRLRYYYRKPITITISSANTINFLGRNNPRSGCQRGN